eukprot:5650486-Amphidinium_carterae.1
MCSFAIGIATKRLQAKSVYKHTHNIVAYLTNGSRKGTKKSPYWRSNRILINIEVGILVELSQLATGGEVRMGPFNGT